MPEALELRLNALTETVRQLEVRVARLEGTQSGQVLVEVAPLRPHPAVEAPHTAGDLPTPVHLMGLIGRTCLILGGATLIRALVDAGTIHRGWGVALGLLYAITWALLANRARHPLDAAFHALASILIAYPLVVESTARFGILTPGLAALMLLTVALFHAVVAWRKDLQLIVWTAALAAIGSGLAMMSACRSIEPFLAVFIVLGMGVLWSPLGRRWQGLRWPTALAANLGTLILTSLAAWPGGIPENYRGITPGFSMAFALMLAFLYIGSFTLRIRQHRQVVTSFEIIQTVLVLLVGFGGACRVALASGTGLGLLGAGLALAGVSCYGMAVPFAEDREEVRANFRFFTTLALVFLTLGGLIALPLGAFAMLSGAMGLGCMFLGLRRRRTLLLVQSALYLLSASSASGLAAWTLRCFLAPAGPTLTLSAPAALSLATLVLALAGFLLRRPDGLSLRRTRPIVLLLGAGVSGGLGGLAIQVSMGVFQSHAVDPSVLAVDPSVLAVVRTGVLSVLILGLAWCGRKLPELELKWLVYPVMIVTALKFLFEDLAVGRPLTLFLGFMCFGATLMLAPRLLKAPAPPDRDEDPNSLKPEVDP